MSFVSSLARVARKSQNTVKTFNSFRLLSTKYAPSHEWVRKDGDVFTVGITKHATEALGDLVYIETPQVGDTFSGGDEFGSVESVKAVSGINCPVSGEVSDANGVLDGAPETVTNDPEGEGWMIKLPVTDDGMADFDGLMDGNAYKEHCDNEDH